MTTCIIVDDEAPARERLRTLLGEADISMEIVAEAATGQEAVPLIHELRPDVLFLDIQMPVLDGFDVVDLLPAPRPHIVFVTAYDQHALRAFDVHALDYLTKPVRLARLNLTLARIAAHDGGSTADPRIEALVRERSAHPLARLTVHVGRRLRILPLEQIVHIEARDKLVYVHPAEGGEHPTDFTLDELEGRLDQQRFLRVHRAHIVNAAFVRELVPWFAGTYMVRLADGTQVPVARRRAREVRELLGGG